MKHLFLALMLAIGFDTSAQVDGMFAFTLDGEQDTVFSLYNSSPDTRNELKDYLLEATHGYDIRDGVWLINLPESKSKVLGELFLVTTKTCVLFDFYVDEIRYLNGIIYHDERFKKPLRVLNEY